MKTTHLLLTVCVMVIWGANYSVIELGLKSLDPFLLTGLRFLCCAIPGVFFVKRPQVPWAVLIGYGVMFGVGLWGMVNLGMHLGVPPGVASILLQLSAFFTVGWGVLLFKEPLKRTQIWGVLLALLGLLVIVLTTKEQASFFAIGCVVLGAFAWSACNILVKHYKPENLPAFVIWSSLFSAIPLFLLSYLASGPHAFLALQADLTGSALFSIAFQAYVTTIFGYSVWSHMLKTYPASHIAPLSLLIPIFGFLTAYLMFDEHVSLAKLAGAALILLGMVFLMFLHKTRQ